jgi:hypothetical protein
MRFVSRSSHGRASVTGYLSRQAKELPPLAGVESRQHCAAIIDVCIAQPQS